MVFSTEMKMVEKLDIHLAILTDPPSGPMTDATLEKSSV